MAANLESDQHMEFEVEDVAQINLFSVNFSSFQRKTLIGGIVSLPILDLELPYQSTDSNSQRMPLAAFIAYKPRSFVSKTLKALEMVTVTFYESDGSKLPSANNHVYLRRPVSLAFKSISEANFGLNSAWICAHYDLQRRMWSSEGCITDLIAKACRCHHLTHFGLLLRPDDQNVGLHHQKPLRMITVGGCCISALALVLTLAFLIYQGKSNDRLRIYKHFSVNLLIVELLMVFGINQTSKGGQNPICLTIGILLHWSLLAAFTWSMLAGFQIYLLLVVIFQADSRSKMQRYRCIGYGVPTILILASVIIDQFSLEGLTYTSNDQCWMRPNMLFLWSFLVPVTTIILINMAMLGLAIYRVCQLDQRPKFLLRQARGLLSLLFILGGTWLIGVANTIFPNLTLTYIFTALNSLQGLLIFVFYVLLSDTFSQILRQFWHWFNEEEIRTNNWNSTTAAVAAK